MRSDGKRRREEVAVRLSAVAACTAVIAAAPAHASWDASGTAALHQVWSENGSYAAGTGNGDAISNIRLTGRLTRLSARSRLEASYSPTGTFFRDRTDLNRLSHAASLRDTWQLGSRSSLEASDAFFYTPEQGATTTTFNTPIVLTGYTDRRSNVADLVYRTESSPVSSYAVDLRHHTQSFGKQSLADSAGLTGGLRYKRDVGPRLGIEVGGSFGRTRFKRSIVDPNDRSSTIREINEVDIANAYAGGRLTLGRSVSLAARLGENRVDPSDPNRPSRSGVKAEVNLQWSGRSIQAQTGYNQGISTGSGTFDASQSRSVYVSLRTELGRVVGAEVLANRTTSENLGSTTSRSVETLSGGARFTFKLGSTVTALAGYTHNTQRANVPGAPDLSFNAYTVGLQARFD